MSRISSIYSFLKRLPSTCKNIPTWIASKLDQCSCFPTYICAMVCIVLFALPSILLDAGVVLPSTVITGIVVTSTSFVVHIFELPALTSRNSYVPRLLTHTGIYIAIPSIVFLRWNHNWSVTTSTLLSVEHMIIVQVFIMLSDI